MANRFDARSSSPRSNRIASSGTSPRMVSRSRESNEHRAPAALRADRHPVLVPRLLVEPLTGDGRGPDRERHPPHHPPDGVPPDPAVGSGAGRPARRHDLVGRSGEPAVDAREGHHRSRFRVGRHRPDPRAGPRPAPAGAPIDARRAQRHLLLHRPDGRVVGADRLRVRPPLPHHHPARRGPARRRTGRTERPRRPRPAGRPGPGRRRLGTGHRGVHHGPAALSPVDPVRTGPGERGRRVRFLSAGRGPVAVAGVSGHRPGRLRPVVGHRAAGRIPGPARRPDEQALDGQGVELGSLLQRHRAGRRPPGPGPGPVPAPVRPPARARRPAGFGLALRRARQLRQATRPRVGAAPAQGASAG